ncbi:fumarylacetoacetate hydrolase family protein [Candidatus Poriferisocius sp.]|uniref:fumarylacetoacetate hydrolase family protein n=1 Tax=Candidatus Poriferisocius sp. TaxID=3101276 RepID=UPI003B027D8F
MMDLLADVSGGFVRVGPDGHERPAYFHEGSLYELTAVTQDVDPSFLASGTIAQVRAAAVAGELPGLDVGPGDRLGPPVCGTRSLVCVGLNYLDHALESSMAPPDEPILFFKATNTIVGPSDDLVVPPDSSKTDWEVELAVVIGSDAWRLPDEETAQAAIAGYAISNDVSERAYQLERGGQWVKGKSCPTFNPLGPVLVPASDFDPADKHLRLSVDGELKQASSTTQMIFSPRYLVWYISQFLKLEPGDIINTGTPSGVGLGHTPPQYLRPGHQIEVRIEGLGTQRTEVAS